MSNTAKNIEIVDMTNKFHQSSNELDQLTNAERFDRQNRVYGIDGTKKLQNGIVVIIGPICDLTYEVCKNLALSGIKHIKLCLNNQIEHKIELNYFKPGEIHLSNIQTFMNQILILNPYLKIELMSNSNVNNLANHQILIIDPSELELNLYKTNKSTENKFVFFQFEQIEKKFIFKFANDFKCHLITDVDGENYNMLVLMEFKSILNSTKYQLKTVGPHNLSNSNLIEIKLDHMENPFRIKVDSVINSSTFIIDTTFVEMENPINNLTNPINNLINSINNLTNPTNNLTNPIDIESLGHFTNGYVNRIKQTMKLNHQELNLKIKTKLEQIANIQLYEINPLLQYYFGALLSSELIKAITCKYIPFDQTYEFEYSDTIALRPNLNLQNKLSNLKCLMIGSGAIGCELLKNLVSLNVAINEGSYIKVTDPDHIEVSNLSRQFLFRSENVSKSKSEVAAYRIKEFNPQTQIIPYGEKLSMENLTWVNQHFPSVDLIFNALDNLPARLFVDSQCVRFQKALFESGTLGTKGNTQPVIPFITESYGASQDQQTEQTFAACTIKNFPSLIQHTIHWAMDDFDGLFNKQPQIINQYLNAFKLSDWSYLDQIQQNEKNYISNILNKILNKLKNINHLDDYVIWAYELWFERFNSRICKLLNTHPVDSIGDNGPFWSNGKKCPIIRSLNKSDKSILDYIISTTKLLMYTYPITHIDQINVDDNLIIEIFNKLDFNIIKPLYSDDTDKFEEIEFIHKSIDWDWHLNVNLNVNSNVNSFHKKAIDNYHMLKYLSNMKIQQSSFEKDDDSNYHVLFVQSTSNNRALNYQIPIADFYQTKGIAGKIIPALATTTSIVASLIMIEMLKYLDNFHQIENYSSSFVNLADNFIIQSEPMPAIIRDQGGVKFSEWGIQPSDLNDINKSINKFESSSLMLLSEFITYWSEKFKCPIQMVLIGTKILYMEGINETNLKKSLSVLITETVNVLKIITEDENIILPDIVIC